MAAKKAFPTGAVFGLLGAGAIAYFAYVLVKGKRVSAATSSGVGGGYSGYGGYGSGYQYGAQDSSSTSSLLDKLLKAFGASKTNSQKQSGTPTGGSSAQYGGGSGSNPLQSLADWWNAGNFDMANNNVFQQTQDGIFAGTDFVNPANYDTSMQYLDVSQFAQNFNPYSDTNANADYSGIYTDFSGGGAGFDPTIPYDVIEGGSGIGDIPDYFTS